MNLRLPERVLVYMAPADLRRSATGLSALVYRHLEHFEPETVYVFLNRRRTHMKWLWHQEGRLHVLEQRLEVGCFRLPSVRRGRLLLTRRQLQQVLAGAKGR